MQLRKLQRLLKEAEEKHGKYIEVCIDTRYAKSFQNRTFVSIADVESRWCVWNPEETVNEAQREVLVLGNY